MANPEHLSILGEGVEAWNAWREANDSILPDLTEADLCEARLRKINFFGAQLQGARLCGADLSEADLNGADLTGADLTLANLNWARLMATNFADANLRQADLMFANLEMAKLQDAGMFEGNVEHLAIFLEGVEAWNTWRSENEDVVPDLTGAIFHSRELHHINLRQTNLSRATFSQCWFFGANLSGATLTQARLTGSDLGGVDLSQANLENAYLSRAALHLADLTSANLRWATLHDAGLNEVKLTGANLQNADLLRADLFEADLSGADLSEASLFQANLTGVNLRGARLCGALLDRSQLSEADLTDADFTGASLYQVALVKSIVKGTSFSECSVYGVSAWGLDLTEVKDQANLVITPNDEPAVTVDNLEIAQFIYLMLHNRKIRDVIDTITGKGVLILGRFTDERKAVLDGIRERLRQLNFVPMVFDWDKPTSRDLTETVQLLANMSRFVVADVTDAKSIPQELLGIVPALPSVPVRPIILAGQREYAMFEHFENYPWVLPVYEYVDGDHLLDNIQEAIISPVEEWEAGADEKRELEERLREKEAEIERLRAALGDKASEA